jgi:hypothetical protein
MWPFLCAGDLLLVQFLSQPERVDQFNVGQILIHRENSEWVAHRLVKFKNKLVLKGDFANTYLYDDEPLVWGLVVGYLRNHKTYFWGSSLPWAAKMIAYLSQANLKCSIYRRRTHKTIVFLSTLLLKLRQEFFLFKQRRQLSS